MELRTDRHDCECGEVYRRGDGWMYLEIEWEGDEQQPLCPACQAQMIYELSTTPQEHEDA